MRNSLLSLILAVLTFSLSTSAIDHPKRKSKSGREKIVAAKLDIYLLIGQSNMAGRAEIEPMDKDSLTQVWLFAGVAGNEWERAANPLNKYSTVRKDLSMQKMGPGYYFAKTMIANRPNQPIGLVVNAKGGTSISEWMPGEKLYNEAVIQVKKASEWGILKGIVWHQGESDVAKTEEYSSKIARLIQTLRKDLGKSKLPFVAGQLSEDQPAREVFNRMILKLPEKVKYTGVATSEGTTTFDKTHFNSSSQRLLGERYAKEMLKLTK